MVTRTALYTENFNKADDTAVLGVTLNFTDLVGSIDNLNNVARCGNTTSSRNRAEHDCTSDDMYAKGKLGCGVPTSSTSQSGLNINYDSASDTCYQFAWQAATGPVHTLLIRKIVAGVSTTLSSTTSVTPAANDEFIFENLNGDLKVYHNGVEVTALSINDTSITGHKRAGLAVKAGVSAARTTTYVDDFEIGDVSASGGTTPVSGSWDTSWDVKKEISGNWQTSWDVKKEISGTWQTSWDVKTSVASTWSTSWDVKQQVSGSWQTSWDVQSSLTQVNSTWSTSWDVKKEISGSWATSWDTEDLGDVWQEQGIPYTVWNEEALPGTDWDYEVRMPNASEWTEL
jgi:hypothetical protein